MLTKQDKEELIDLITSYLDQQYQGLFFTQDHVNKMSQIRIKLIEEVKEEK